MIMFLNGRRVAACALVALLVAVPAQAVTIIAEYEFDVAGNLGLDTSGFGNHATNNGVTQGLDRLGNPSAGVFNGSTANLTKAGGLTGYDGLPGFTFAAWVNRSSADGGWGGIVSQDPAGGACCTNRFLLSPGDTPYVDAGAHADFSYGAPVIPNDQWVHLVMAADDTGPGNTVRIYVNGVFAGSNVFGHDLANSSLFDTFVGTGENGNAHHWQGLLDEVLILDGAVDASGAFRLFNTGSVLPEPASMSLLAMAAAGLALRRRRA